MKKLMFYIRPYFFKMAIQFIIKFSGTIVELLLPWMLSYIIDYIVPLQDMGKVYLWGGMMILCAAGALIANITANRMSTKISRNITQKIRHDLFEKISYLSCRQTDKFSIPSLISRLTSDTYNVHHMIDRMQRLGIRAPILLLGGIIVTLSLEPVLTLVLICTLPLLGAVVWFVSHKGIPMYTKAQTSLDKLVRKVQENMTGIRVIRALSKTEYENKCFDDINKEVIKTEQSASALMAITNPIMNLLLNVGLTLVIIIGAYRVNQGVTMPGKIIAFLSYFTIILNALMMVTRMFVMYSKGAASANRISEVLCDEDQIKTIPSKACDNSYHIEFNNVTFSYNKKVNNLEDISFKLKQGQTLGIVGATGSGKSTIISLLLRFYDTDSGEITINGHNIASIPDSILHTQFGVVFQNDFLFADTIKENIDFGRSIDESQIKSSVKAAQADFIYEKDGGILFELTQKGSNLSGGQKQRLLIARALASNPEILLLDDCSSALDYKTDADLRNALAHEFKDTTTIIVAQRISSIMNTDIIIVLDEGKIIGQGKHEELLSSCEAYKEIYEVQMGKAGNL